MIRLALISAFVLLPAATSWARGNADVSVVTAPAAPSSRAPALADQLDTMLTLRFEAAAQAVPERDVATRRQALLDLDAFAAVTIDGLIAAAPGGEMRDLMIARLQPILARHRANIAEVLSRMGASAHALPPNTLMSSGDLRRVADGP